MTHVKHGILPDTSAIPEVLCRGVIVGCVQDLLSRAVHAVSIAFMRRLPRRYVLDNGGGLEQRVLSHVQPWLLHGGSRGGIVGCVHHVSGWDVCFAVRVDMRQLPGRQVLD
jgi:hypothetical protein